VFILFSDSRNSFDLGEHIVSALAIENDGRLPSEIIVSHMLYSEIRRSSSAHTSDP
jgi:hypothetical protein